MNKIDQILADTFGNDAESSSTLVALEAMIDSSSRSLDAMLRTDVSVFVALESALRDGDVLVNLENSTITFAALENVLNIATKTIDGYMGGTMTFAAFEAFIDESLSSIDDSVESVLEGLLSAAKNTIDTKCTSLEECDKMMETLAMEAAKFNDCMINMIEAGKDLKAGNIDKNTFKNRIAPSIVELKSSCLSIGAITPEYAAEGANTISDEAIVTVRDFIIGTESLLNEKRKSFGGNDDTSLESFIATCGELLIATEGVNMQTKKLLKSDEIKAARKLVKTARKTAKGRTPDSLEKAIEMLKQAKVLVQKIKKEINDMPEPITKWEKLKATMTPLFTLLPREEQQDGYSYDQNGGLSYHFKPVDDEFSKSTASYLKKSLQQILNLLLKNIDKDISVYSKEKGRVSSKATESVEDVEFFINTLDIALESDTCCDDEDDIDDETLQEILDGIDEDEEYDEDDDTSFDCYLK